MIEAHIVFVAGPMTGTVISLGQPDLSIGRSRDCTFIIHDDCLSRHHCVLLNDKFGVRIRDLGSKNGTLVNGDRLGAFELSLANGDVVTAGVSSLRIVFGTLTDDQCVAIAAEYPTRSASDQLTRH